MSNYEAWMEQMRITQEKNVIIVLKGAYSSVSLPNGTLHINTSGNPGMATAGCGDVLTGIITSLLAQNYSPQIAAVMGVFIHGNAADVAVEQQEEEETLIASDIINNLHYCF